MFTAKLITIFLIAMFASIGIYLFVEKRQIRKLATLVLVVGLIASMYCLSAGIFLFFGWHDPLAAATTEQIANASVKHGGKGGIVILAIKYWPYVLIGSGGYFSYSYFQILRMRSKQ
jgi:hypothetical protein